MKTKVVFIALLIFSHNLFGQNKKTGVNSRISFVVGLGASGVITGRTLYQDPVINQSSNFVTIDEAQYIRSNVSLGIAYTPYLWNVDGETVPKGFTMTAFFNPIAITKVSEGQQGLSLVDFGFGMGHKFAGGFMVLATVDFFGLRQPKKSFIDEYKGNNKPYIINNSTQLSIDPKDNTIFQNILVTSVGLKICYTFDVIRNYNGQIID